MGIDNEEPIKKSEYGQCVTCGGLIEFTVLLFPGRTVKMGECKRGHWNQREELIDG